VAGQPDEPVAQVALLDEHENDEDDHETRARHGVKELRHAHEVNGLVLDGDGNRHGLPLRQLLLLELTHDLAGRGRYLLQGPWLSHTAQIGNLPPEVPSILRQIVAEPDDLLGHDVADPSQNQRHEDDNENDRHDPTPARAPEAGPLKGAHQRAEHEAQEQGHRNRNDNGLSPVQRRDDRDSKGADEIGTKLSQERASLVRALTLSLWQGPWADNGVAPSHKKGGGNRRAGFEERPFGSFG
jgi:hypothetical protein